MKVNQIVSEHKKGVRAMKYTKKTKGTVPVYGPDSTDAKLKPVKPVGTNEAVEITPMPGASQVSVDGKPIATTDAATAQAISQAAEKGQFTTTDGTDQATTESHMSEIDDLYHEWLNSEDAPMDDEAGNDNLLVRKAMRFIRGQVDPENAEDIAIMMVDAYHDGVDESGHEIGGDPTDKFIQDVSFNEQSTDKYFVDVSTGSPMIKSGNGLTPVQPSKMWQQLTPEIEAKALSQGFRKIKISLNGQVLFGLEGGGKVIVSPVDYQAMSGMKEVQSPFPSRNETDPAKIAANAAVKPGTANPAMPSRNKVQEADDILLGKMLAIAGLR